MLKNIKKFKAGGRSRRGSCVLLLIVVLASGYNTRAHADPATGIALPARERQIIKAVADDYKLNPDQTRLLYVIRKIEHGKQGREFGILHPDAMRYAGKPVTETNAVLSFTLQAEWAAGTVKKRYSGDLLAFANRYCPIGAKNDPTGLNNNWYKNAKYYMNKK